MVFSPLTARTVAAHGKYNSRQGASISRIIVHHWAGTQGGDSRLVNPNEAVSANYILYSDGTLVGQVPEEYRAWTTGGPGFDNPSITVEIQNSSVGGDWPISDKAYLKLIQLIADLAKRYGWGGVTSARVRGHREFVATACPGPYVFTRFGDIIAKSQAAFAGGGSVTPAPVNPPTSGKSISQLADAVLRGEYGNGAARRAALGSQYDAVQAEVNRRIYGTTTPSAPASKSISQLADEVLAGKHGNGSARVSSLGANYNAVQAEVNRRLGIAVAPSAPSTVDIGRLATAVIRGDYGNGAARREALGSNYAAVQAEVNRRLGY